MASIAVIAALVNGRLPANPLEARACKNLRRLLRGVVTDSWQKAALIRACEKARMLFGSLRRQDAISLALERDGRHRDFWPFGQLPLDAFQRRIARRAAVTMPIRVDRHGDEIGIIERGRAALECCVIECPMRRP